MWLNTLTSTIRRMNLCYAEIVGTIISSTKFKLQRLYNLILATKIRTIYKNIYTVRRKKNVRPYKI